MPAKIRTDVLVVGAGPVGLLTACLLSRHGLRVRIIDQNSGPELRSDACLLHSRTVSLLNNLGLDAKVSDLGHQVETICFYEARERRAEVKLSELGIEFPLPLMMPQGELKELLESRLKHAGIEVAWNHRLSELDPQGEKVAATIQELAISAKGYIIPHMDWEVEKTEQLQARYVVGADGDDSRVAQLVGIGYEVASGPEFYLICELESDWAIQDEVCVVLDPEMTSLLWPLGGNTFRWCFQLNEEDLGHFPFKERSFISIEQPALDQANRESIEALLEQRAPWFTGAIGDVHWSTGAQFTRRLAARFGDHRCWLLGDAAHVTSPAGMQSMNCGLAEAEQLASLLASILQKRSGTQALDQFSRNCREQWHRLLGINGPIQPQPGITPWVRDRAARILSSIPASSRELGAAAKRLALDFEGREC